MTEDADITETLRQFAKAKDEFCEAHQAGMSALERADYHALAEAIAHESAAIDKQRAIADRLHGKRSHGRVRGSIQDTPPKE